MPKIKDPVEALKLAMHNPQNLENIDDSVKTIDFLKKIIKYSTNAIEYVNQTHELCIYSLNCHAGESIQYIKNQTPELCDLAVELYVYNIKNVKDQRPELCMKAVKTLGLSIGYISNQTPELCMAAVNNHGASLQHVKEQTTELCVAALAKNGSYLEYVTNKTPELCKLAIEQNGEAYRYLPEDLKTEEWAILAAHTTPRLLSFLDNPSEPVIASALEKDGYALEFLDPNQPISDALYIIAGNQNYLVTTLPQFPKHLIQEVELNTSTPIQSLESLNNKEILQALTKDGTALRFLSTEQQTQEMQTIAVNQNPFAIKYISDPSEELSLLAIKQNPATLLFATLYDDVCITAIKACPQLASTIEDPSPAVKVEILIQHPHLAQHINPYNIVDYCNENLTLIQKLKDNSIISDEQVKEAHRLIQNKTRSRRHVRQDMHNDPYLYPCKPYSM